MRSLRSLLVRSVARLLVASCVVAGLSPAILSLSDGMVSMVAETAYAQAAGTPAAAQPTGQAGSTGTNNGVTTGAELANKGIGVANGIVQAAFMLMNPILMLASWLLSPDWTFGDIFNMRPVLHDLWVLVSNIVYVIFAIALLVIAVLNIFGNQTYQIKSVLPKFVGGIIIVPLSWFIVSAVLSIANVLTASMLNLPYDTFTSNTSLQGNDIIQRIQNYNLPSRCVLDFEKKPATPAAGAGTPASDAESTGETINCGGENGPKVSLSELFSTDGSPYSILYVYAYGIFRVDTLQKITVANSINTASDVVFGLFSGLIGFIIMLLLFIGIVFVLFIRVIQLWVFAILSPLFGLFLFLGENVLGDSSLKKYNIKEFISLAMVPVYISAALSFGLMLVLTVATSTVDPEETTGNSYVQMKTSTDGKEESITIGNNQDPTKRFSLIVK